MMGSLVQKKETSMNTTSYNCPACGAPLAFDAQSGKMMCASCGTVFDAAALEGKAAAGNREEISFESAAQRLDGGENGLQGYLCKNCGAELMTEDTTTALECPYCGSPTVLPDRLSGGVKPEVIIPFQITREQAQRQFNDYFKGKRLLPNLFLEGRNRIAEMRKLYVPYWLFSCISMADISYNAQRVEKERSGDWEITRTKHYVVRRSGCMRFENIPVDGSEKMDDRITESIEPYDMRAAVPFQPAMLAGTMADHADVEAEACRQRAVQRVENSVSDTLRATVKGYDTVTEDGKTICSSKGRAVAALMPVWLITTVKENKTYTFAINGQTGKLTCDVPADKKKAVLWGGGIFAVIFALTALLLALLDTVGSGTLLMGGIFALLVALGAVGMMKGKLRQSVSQAAAASYLVKDSLKLERQDDYFMYEDTDQRKVGTSENQKK